MVSEVVLYRFAKLYETLDLEISGSTVSIADMKALVARKDQGSQL